MLPGNTISVDIIKLQEKISNSDQVAFRQFFDLFASPLLHFAFVILKHRDVALEVVDDVFIKIWKQRERITEIENIRVYLYRAVKNSALNYLEKKANQLITEPFDFMNIDLQCAINPEDEMISDETMEQINKAVESLPPRCKMVFKLIREDGLKYREVAEILNISENTVDAQMVIAVKRISTKVIQSFDYFPAAQGKK
ncbi:MAG: RNA polymerase sigma-70 factor [Ginsengibacter sp.]